MRHTLAHRKLMLVFSNTRHTMALPFDLLEKIADMADIDTRRNMGFPPKKLPRSRITALEDKIKYRLDMQYRYLNDTIFTCTTILPVEKTKTFVYLYYSTERAKSYLCMMSIKQFDDIDIVDDGIKWLSTCDHAVHVNHLFAKEQIIYTTHVNMMNYANLTPKNKDVILKHLP